MQKRVHAESELVRGLLGEMSAISGQAGPGPSSVAMQVCNAPVVVRVDRGCPMQQWGPACMGMRQGALGQ